MADGQETGEGWRQWLQRKKKSGQMSRDTQVLKLCVPEGDGGGFWQTRGAN